MTIFLSLRCSDIPKKIDRIRTDRLAIVCRATSVSLILSVQCSSALSPSSFQQSTLKGIHVISLLSKFLNNCFILSFEIVRRYSSPKMSIAAL